MVSSLARATIELSGGRARFTQLSAGGHLRPRPMDVDGPRARLALVSTYAALLAGDDLRVQIDVGPGVVLDLVEPSGTVAYDMRGGRAEWSAHVQVAAGGQLSWRASPFVVSSGADVVRRTQIDVAAGGRALVSEMVVLGRSYETGAGPVRSTMHASYADRPLLIEDVDLRRSDLRDSPGVLADNRAMASIVLLGEDLEDVHGRHETRLAGPGALARAVAVEAHLAEAALEPTWTRWLQRMRPTDTGDDATAADAGATGGRWSGRPGPERRR